MDRVYCWLLVLKNVQLPETVDNPILNPYSL